MIFARLFAAGLAGALLGTVAPAASVAAEVKLKAASFLPPRAVVAKPFYRWVDEVNKRCAGTVSISAVGPEAIGSLEQWRALKDGVVDMHFGPPNYYKGVMVEGDVTILANTSSAEQRANGAWEMLNKLHNEKMNAQYLTHVINGVKFFLYTNKPHKNGRFDGFRIRSVPIYDDFFKSLGAEPVRMAPPEVYTALERNTVEGYGWPSWGITDFGWDKHTKFRHGPGFFSAVVNILVNLDKWQSLADDQRACLNDMAAWLEAEWPKWRAEEDKVQYAALDKAGIKYVDMGEAFSRQAENMYWDMLMKENAELIAKFRPLLVK